MVLSGAIPGGTDNIGAGDRRNGAGDVADGPVVAQNDIVAVGGRDRVRPGTAKDRVVARSKD
jgi:hypothetical protein